MKKNGEYTSTLTQHHRDPKCLGGSGDPKNISHIDRKKHWAWTLLFDKLSAHMIAERMNAVYFDHNHKVVVVRAEYYEEAKKMLSGLG